VTDPLPKVWSVSRWYLFFHSVINVNRNRVGYDKIFPSYCWSVFFVSYCFFVILLEHWFVLCGLLFLDQCCHPVNTEVNIYYAGDHKWSKRELIHWICLHWGRHRHCWLGGRKGIRPVKNGGWWRWALVVCPDGVAPSRMVGVSAFVNLPCTIKSRSSLLTLAHPGGPGKRAVK